MSGASSPVTTVAGSPLTGRPVQGAVVDTDLVFALVQVGAVLVPSLVSRATLHASVLALSGGTLTGPLVLQANPTEPLGAATKAYVDEAVAAAFATAAIGGSTGSSLSPEIAVDASGNLVLSGDGLIVTTPLPTAEPATKGQLWNNGGYLGIASGAAS